MSVRYVPVLGSMFVLGGAYLNEKEILRYFMMAKDAVTSYEIFRYISLNSLGVQSINNVNNFLIARDV